MDKAIITTLINNIEAPAFITDEAGKIIEQNKTIRYIKDIIGIDELKDLEDLKLCFFETENKDIAKFVIEKSNIEGICYKINVDEKRADLFIFHKGIATDHLIVNVMEHIDEVVVIFNKDGVIEKMNSVCDQILPFKRKDVIGKNIRNLVEDGIVKESIILKMLKSKKKEYQDIVYPNGKIISYTALPSFSYNGNIRGGVLTGRDISRILRLVNRMTPEIQNDDVKFISVNEKIIEIKNMIKRIGPSEASVFIMGESGVGKEILAKTIWKQSNRKEKPMVAINCAAIPSELIESELFGYEKGAFTGAKSEGKIGIMESANGGTLFLDEIGEMPLNIQKKLLRVLQEKNFMRIGGVTPIDVDIRFICATNRRMDELMDESIFRRDLYYRIAVIPITVPPLRERLDDIEPLCKYYLEYFNKKYLRNLGISEGAIEKLQTHNWIGNVRELKNIMERLVVLSPYDDIKADDVDRILNLDSIVKNDNIAINNMSIEKIKQKETDIIIDIDELSDIDEAYQILETKMIKNAIKKYGNITNAAKAIGLNPSTVYRKIKNGYINIDE